MAFLRRSILIMFTVLTLFSCKKSELNKHVSSFPNLHLSTATVKFLSNNHQHQAVLMLKNGDYLLPYNLNAFDLELKEMEKVQISYVINKSLTMEGYPEGDVVVLSYIDSCLTAMLE